MISENLKNKLHKMGVEPESMIRQMQNYIGEGKAFASPQEYAKGIMAKETAGTPLQDPQTAQAFRQVAPTMFGEAPPQRTEFPFPVGETPGGLDPGTHAMLGAIQQYQQETPFSVPYAPGTPTIAQTEAERAAERQEKTFQEGVRQFDLGHELALRQQAHREAMDKLARVGGGGVATTVSATGFTEPAAVFMHEINKMIRENPDMTLDQIRQMIYGVSAELAQGGVKLKDALDFAEGAYEAYHRGQAETYVPPKVEYTPGMIPSPIDLRPGGDFIPAWGEWYKWYKSTREYPYGQDILGHQVSEDAKQIAERYGHYYSPEQVQRYMDEGILNEMVRHIPEGYVTGGIGMEGASRGTLGANERGSGNLEESPPVKPTLWERVLKNISSVGITGKGGR